MKPADASWRVVARALTCLSLAVVAACGSDASPAGFTERDSSGIRIAENRGAPAQTWTVTAEPLVEIGAVEGDTTQLFHNVSGALVVGDRIVIAHGAAPLLRWFDREGKFVQGAGRTGGGPGEFQGLEGGGRVWALWPLGPDSIATWEHSPRRMQVFDAKCAIRASGYTGACV
ncbi:MAG: hypothetical protein ACRENP_06545 [Longimicrobiales bacterium]